jgi:hypothetical protein
MSTTKYNPEMPSERFDAADMHIISHSSIGVQLASDPTNRFDSAEDANVYFARELDFVKSKTYDILYPELNALKLFPVSSSVPVGVDTFTYYSYDISGWAKVISDYSQDLPRADVSGKPFTAIIRDVGESYGYNIHDIEASRYAGKSLDVKRGEAARKIIDRTINKFAWVGDPDSGIRGVLSSENQVPVWTPPQNAAGTSSKFIDKTPDEILKTFSLALKYMSDTTKGVEKPDTIVLDEGNYIYLSTTPRSDKSDTTILGWLRNNLPDIKFERAGELMGGTEFNPYAELNVMVIYKNDPSKVEIEIPLMFQQQPVEVRGMEYIINCRARLAGAVVYYPLSMLVVPGV